MKKILIIIFMVLHMILPLSVHAENKVVRVGYYYDNGTVLPSQSDVDHQSYDYEYLNKIATYTGWKYEYVEGSLEECLEMLSNGKIDMLSRITKSPQREKDFLFSKESTISTTNCLLSEKSDNRFGYEDFKSFNDMKIGYIKGSNLVSILEKYAQDNHFSYELIGYDTIDELRNALNQKRIDSMYLTNISSMDKYKVIAHFEHTYMYVAINKERQDLKNELDNAIEKIHLDNVNYENVLYNKYFSNHQFMAFTHEENEYIKKNKVIDVILFSEFPIICDYNKETMTYQGMIVDYLMELSDKTGLNFNFLQIPFEKRWEYVVNHPNTLVAPTLNNEIVKFDNQITFLDTAISSRMVAVTKNNKDVNLSSNFNLVIDASMLEAKNILLKKYPKANIILSDSVNERLDMVCDGEADMTLINAFSGTYLLQSPFYTQLNMSDSEYFVEDITLSLCSQSDPLLMSILNKSIDSFDERDIRQIVLDNTLTTDYELTTEEWFYKYKEIIILTTLLIIISITLIYFLTHLRIKNKKHEIDLIYQEELFKKSHFNSLTNLYNKDYFVEKTTQLMEEHPETIYSIFRLHIKDFKLINQIYGKNVGDYVLIHIADRIKTLVNDKGIYGHLHSDHFVVCYPSDKIQIDKLPLLLEESIVYEDKMIPLRINIGVYVNDQHIINVFKLIDYTKVALQYIYTENSQNINVFKDEYLNLMMKQQEINNEKEKALSENQFKVYYQPQYDISNKYIVGAEALIRWIHPTKGIISPADFIPIFEKNHFIFQLDQFVFDEVCKQVVELKNMGKMIPISINLSRVDLEKPELFDILKNGIEKYQIEKQYIHLEITESVYSQSNEEVLSIVNKLQEYGFTIEMDDFGSGYSSLNMLKEIPIDVLKIDLKFFQDETNMEKGGSIIRSVVELAHNLGIMVVAEGVETEREVNFLNSIHCFIAQGYYFNKPLPKNEFLNILEKTSIADKNIQYNQDNLKNEYWNIEKFYRLLNDNQNLILDYNPNEDNATFTFMNSKNIVNEKNMKTFVKTLYKNASIHVDDRKKIKDILSGFKEVDEDTFKADILETGVFICYHAKFHYYYSNEKLNRVIAIIKQNK